MVPFWRVVVMVSPGCRLSVSFIAFPLRRVMLYPLARVLAGESMAVISSSDLSRWSALRRRSNAAFLMISGMASSRCMAAAVFPVAVITTCCMMLSSRRVSVLMRRKAISGMIVSDLARSS